MTDLIEQLRLASYIKPISEADLHLVADGIERLTAELARSYAYAKTLEQEVFDAETKENEATELWEKERCFSQDLIKQLTETRDLAEHWMIIAEQRRVELGGYRKAIKDFIDYQDVGGKEEPPYLFWDEKVEAMRAAMETKP